jgi:GAF domain-containing protein
LTMSIFRIALAVSMNDADSGVGPRAPVRPHTTKERYSAEGVIAMTTSVTRLYINKGPMKGHSFDLNRDVTDIGRGSENDIQIKDGSMSRKHARILNKGDSFFIEDLESQNGIWIHGQRIRPGESVQIQEGLLVTIGNIPVSLGKAYTEDGMVTQYSIDLSGQIAERETNLLYKNRRITNREKLELIYEVSTTLSRTLDVNQIFNKIMDSLFHCLKRIDSGAIILLDHETGELNEIIARTRDNRETFEMKYSRTIVNRVLREGKAVMMSDTSLEDEDDLSKSIEMMRIKSIMCVPLISQARRQGVIYAHSVNVPRGFRKDDLFLLTALSSPAAVAIENALLYSKSRQAEEALQEIRNELEKRVEERTAELSTANTLLRREIAEHKEAQDRLEPMHEELKEANKNLGLAYAQMRAWKDQLSAQLHSEEIGFLIDENGRIMGVTDKAAESFELSRIDLLSMSIMDLLEKSHREKVKDIIRKARAGIYQQTSLCMSKTYAGQPDFRAKLMQLNVKRDGKLFLMLMRRPDRWERPIDCESDPTTPRQE